LNTNPQNTTTTTAPTTPITGGSVTTPTTQIYHGGYTPPAAVSPPTSGTWTLTATQDVWLKSGPGSAYGNIVVVSSGNQVGASCVNRSGQADYTTSGASSTLWYQSSYNGSTGWISANYLRGPTQSVGNC
jgi:uncharacterized protein YgiM (DUF1202 family)